MPFRSMVRRGVMEYLEILGESVRSSGSVSELTALRQRTLTSPALQPPLFILLLI